VLSVILHGSLATGSFEPALSDVDLLVVVGRSLTDGELATLERLVVGSHEARVDFRVVTRAVAAAPTPDPTLELYVGLHGDEPEILRRAVERDLVAELSIVRAGGRSLVGAEPSAVVGVVPVEWVVAYGDEHLARWQGLTDDAHHAELMVLTTCRIWRFATEGVHCSKADAGRWALVRDPSLAAVEAALRQRAGNDVRMKPAEIANLLARVRAEIASPKGAPSA
jgi:predicted nucleotidyltransferase